MLVKSVLNLHIFSRVLHAAVAKKIGMDGAKALKERFVTSIGNIEKFM